ncbi:MAG TPA: hypothetical protein VFO10_11825 [Oligoflexus sp.]|uniref:hypothetical protein n=1 Tax=Oligoflexus sp. TaxID=1971216 RepID=UPI002D7F46E2|nr:hypothetical protein [Oligoflexus sp.]HET9237936.1 hypothetical protein [Oligoflexus sp.]
MRLAFQFLAWFLALLSLLADSYKTGSRAVPPDLTNGYILPEGSIHEVRISCATTANEPCSGFRTITDLYLDSPEGRAYLMTYNGFLNSPLLVELPGIESVSHDYFDETGLPNTFKFDAPYGSPNWTVTQDWKDTVEFPEFTITIEIKPHVSGDTADNQHLANCRMLGTDPRTQEFYVFRNIVIRPGFINYDPVFVHQENSSIPNGGNFPSINVYDGDNELIPVIQSYQALLFDKDRVVKRVEIPAKDRSIYICSEDLQNLEQSIEFTVVEP